MRLCSWHGVKRQDRSLKTNHFTPAPWRVPPIDVDQTNNSWGVYCPCSQALDRRPKNTGRMSQGCVKVISPTPDWCGRRGGTEWAGQAVADAGVGACETELMLTLLHVTHHKHMFSSIPGSCLQTKKRAHVPCFLKAAPMSGDSRGQRWQMATAGSAAREALAC